MSDQKSTYDPIGEASNTIPAGRPGFVIVRLCQGRAELMSEQSSAAIMQSLFGTHDHRIIFAAVGIAFFLFVISIALFGQWLTLLFSILIVGTALYLKLNRHRPLMISLLGPAPIYHLVDVSAHVITDQRNIQIGDIGVFAEIHLEYTVNVENRLAPQVVEKGIRDVREYISAKIYAEIDRIAAQGKLSDKMSEMRRQLKELSRRVGVYREFSIRNVTFEVHLDQELVKDVRKEAVVDIKKGGISADHQINEYERRYYESLIENEDELLAELMRPGADKRSLEAAINAIHSRGEIYFDRKMKQLKLALENGVLEPHNFEQCHLDYLKGLIYSAGPKQTQKVLPAESVPDEATTQAPTSSQDQTKNDD